MKQIRMVFTGIVVALALLPAQLCAQDSFFLQEAVQKWKNASEYTLEVARAMPAEKFGFRPVDEEFTFGEQLEHIAENMVWLASAHLLAKKMEHPLWQKKDRSPAEIIEVLEAALAYAGDAIAATSPEALSQKGGFLAGPMSKRQIITLMNDHQTHHRGQLIVYLRLNGIKPPKYIGW